MAELFQRDRRVIGKHIKNVFDEGELRKESVWANSVLQEYLIKGFAMNDELLKKAGGGKLMNCSNESVISSHLRRCSGGKYSIFTRPAWITIPEWKHRFYFSRPFKTKCTEPRMVRRR